MLVFVVHLPRKKSKTRYFLFIKFVELHALRDESFAQLESLLHDFFTADSVLDFESDNWCHFDIFYVLLIIFAKVDHKFLKIFLVSDMEQGLIWHGEVLDVQLSGEIKLNVLKNLILIFHVFAFILMGALLESQQESLEHDLSIGATSLSALKFWRSYGSLSAMNALYG